MQRRATTTATPADAITAFFRARGKRVIAFAGFGELGYDDEGIVERITRDVLAAWRPEQLLVIAGTLLRVGGEDGIADVYRVARSLGFETAGLHPSIAFAFATTHRVSPYCDHVFFVEDDSWGGFTSGTREPSNTMSLVLAVTDELVVIGGGKHAADELEAFVRSGKAARYFAARMNRRATDEWCRRSGADVGDERGAAYARWRALVDAGYTAAFGTPGASDTTE